MAIIKAGFLISYDYEFIKESLPRVYDYVDEIYFALDTDGLTWSGAPLHIADEFWQWLKRFDQQNKIQIYRESFYLPGLTPIQCETRARTLLNKRMGKADWYVQIDADEYFLDFKTVAEKLTQLKVDQPTTVCCGLVTLFKQVSGGFLLIKDAVETLSFATNNSEYELTRSNSANVHLHWPDLVLHQSWARPSEDIWFKLNNWGHKHDFNVTSFYKLWNAIDEHNFYCLSNFHPLYPPTWPGLVFMIGGIKEILESENLNGVAMTRGDVKRKSLLSRIWKEIKA